MSWIVEQSENISAVTVNDDVITSTKDGYYGSPVNVKYNDPADQNEQYFWLFEFQGFDGKGGVSVGLTTQQGFKAGWGLKGMNYLGNLSDGSGLLVSRFGDSIQSNDKVGLLLELTDAELKLYIFHNDRPLGLAFNIQAPYPKPLYPVVSFSANGTVKISRSQQIPISLNRTPLQFTGIEGTWKISAYPQHPECVGIQFEINRCDQDENTYKFYAKIINTLNCTLKRNSATTKWQSSPIISTRKGGPPEEMNKERLLNDFISNIDNLHIQNVQQLIIENDKDEKIQAERFIKMNPSAVTQNIFNE